jgi:hypothetical protein
MTIGSAHDRSHIPLSEWLLAIDLLCKIRFCACHGPTLLAVST